MRRKVHAEGWMSVISEDSVWTDISNITRSGNGEMFPVSL